MSCRRKHETEEQRKDRELAEFSAQVKAVYDSMLEAVRSTPAAGMEKGEKTNRGTRREGQGNEAAQEGEEA